MRLTAKERILIHLADYAKFAENVEVPPDIGQDGIARAAGIHVQHLRQFVNPLLKDGLVRERMAHVAGHRRRLKVYDLTDSGRLVAARLRAQVRERPIRIRHEGEIKETTVGEALRGAEGIASLSDIVREAVDQDVVDLTALQAARTSAFIERVKEAPHPRTFVGRSKELETLTQGVGGSRLFFVRGVAGIGKSSLAAKACESLRGTRNLYWHRIRTWDTRLAILADIAEFLAALGRPGLRSVLERGDGSRADQILREDLTGTKSAFVFDDAHDAAPEVLALLRFLKDVLVDARDLRMIVLSRRTLPIYDRRDVALHGLVHEIDLRGLAADEIAAMLSEEPASVSLRDAARRLGGHPLFLELMRSTAVRGLAADSLTDVRRFVEEEIYAGLADDERRMMKIAALYVVPVPREALFADPKLSHDILLSLVSKALIRPVGEEAFGVHDTIRDFFATILTGSERAALAPVATAQLLRLSADARTRADFVGSLNCLSNALQLAASREEEAPLWEAVGDTNERLGDMPAALVAYAEAVRRARDPESLARIHRKTAAALIVRGDIDPAVAEIQAGFAALGDRTSAERGWFDLLLCRIAVWREEWAEARGHGEAALAAFHGANDAFGHALTSSELAAVEIYSPTGNPAEAERYLRSALEVSRTMRDREFEARVRIALANLYANRIGDVDRATRQWNAIEGLQDSITDPHVRRNMFMIKGWFSLYQKADYRAAESLFTQSLTLARRIHDPATLAFAKYGLAMTLYFDGQIAAARDAFDGFASEADAQGTPGYAMEARWMVAECCLRLGDVDGFRRIAAEFRDPKRSAGVAARPVHGKVIEALDALLNGDSSHCEAAFADALRLLGTYVGAPDAMLAGFAHAFYGLAILAIGDDGRGEEQRRRTTELLDRHGLRAQLSVLNNAGPQIVQFLRLSASRRPVGVS